MTSGGVSDVLDLIEMLAQQTEPMTVSAVAAETALAKSSCHRLLALLVERGYVERRDSKRYKLVRPVGLGGMTPYQSRLVVCAEPILQSAAVRSGVSAFVAVLLPSGRLRYLAKQVPVGEEMIYDRDITKDRDPHLVASGKCLLAFAGSEATADDAAIREQGLVINLHGVMEGASGVAAPVFDASGTCVAAINLAGPRERFAGANLEKIIEECRAAARVVTARLGEGTEGEKL